MKIDLSKVQQSLLSNISESFSDIQHLNKERLVYLLVQIRKVLEISDLGKNENFTTLTFFIDWTLHSRKNKNRHWYKSVKDKVLLSIEKSREIRKAKGIEREIDINDKWSHEFFENIKLRYLHEDLSKFSNRYNLKFEALADIEKFSLFRDVMMEVLAEVPIEIEDSECPISTIQIQSSDNKTKVIQEVGTAKHVCDFVLLFRDETFSTWTFFDATVPIKYTDSRP